MDIKIAIFIKKEEEKKATKFNYLITTMIIK